MGVDRTGFWVLAAREGKSGDYATTLTLRHERANNNHPWPLLKLRRGISYLPRPLLIKEGSFALNLSLFRREL
jgi:hypothetical protein